MITGTTKNKADKIWEIFWTGGITNALFVIEQFTSLIFIKNLDEKQTRYESDAAVIGIATKEIFTKDQQDIRWKIFKQLNAEQMYKKFTNRVFLLIKTVHSNKDSSFMKYMGNETFKIVQNEFSGLDSRPVHREK